MASSTQKGISGAAGGAGLGFMVGGPLGAAVGGGLGFLGGLLGGSDPDITAPSFADINLQTQNPDLFARLQQQQQFVNEAQKLYQNRIQGMTPLEDQQYQSAMKDVGRNSALSGIAGGSDAYALANNAAMQQQNNIAARIYSQQNGLLQQYGNAQQGLFNNTQSALNDVMGQQNKQLGINENNLSNSNQMWSGIGQAGLSAIGSAYNASKMGQMPAFGAGQNPSASLPAGYAYGAPGQGLQYASSPQAVYGVPGGGGLSAYSGVPSSFSSSNYGGGY